MSKKPNLLFTLLVPWMFGALSIFALLSLILLTKVEPAEKPETLVVRPLDVQLTPPPEPPPPERPVEQTSNPTPSINLMGPGNGPELTYSESAKPAMNNLAKVEQPQFDRNKIDLAANLSVDFPILEVQELDSVPRLLSTNRINFPRTLRERGVNRVATQVEIIIDQQGRAYVKKIIDPVYPEMVDIIRKAINDSRFTTPTKNGRPVQAVYLYTLMFINKV
jgi:protein TonB